MCSSLLMPLLFWEVITESGDRYLCAACVSKDQLCDLFEKQMCLASEEKLI